MEAFKLPSLVALLLLLAFQETVMLPADATMCEAKSRLFRGACFRPENCGSLCEKEGFATGRCKFWKCVCIKECNNGATPVKTPPSDDQPPPIDGDDQPGEGPPSEDGPGEGPPSEDEPGEEPQE